MGVSQQFEPGAPVDEEGIPLCAPHIRGNEWAYVKECLDTNWVSSAGPFVDRFEAALASRVSAKYGVATASGTAALHVALLVAGVQPEDEVLVSTLTFIAPANAIRYVGAWPVFIDADSRWWQMDPEKVVDFVRKECEWKDGALHNRLTGRRVKALMPVHILGHPVDMDSILEVARQSELVVIEDATESLGARYRDHAVGHLGDIACFSFNGNKLITTGGGGMLVTDNQGWAQKARYLTTQAKDDPLESVHNEIGFNYRLTNVQAAIGCAQLETLDEHVAAKRQHAFAYTEGLADVPGITVMPEAPWAFSVFWLYTVVVNRDEFGKDSRALMRALAQANIQTRPLWQALHLSPAHARCQAYRCEVAGGLVRTGLSLPSSVGLTPDQQAAVIERIRHMVRV